MTSGKALLIIDMLNDFIIDGAPLKVEGAQKIIPNIVDKIKECEHEIIVFVNDSHKEDDPEFKKWPPHAIVGTDGSFVVKELMDACKGLPNTFVVMKSTYDGFLDTELESLLVDHHIEELELTGVCTDICVISTGLSAINCGFKTRVIDDCCMGINPKNSQSSLSILKTLGE